MAEDFWPHLHDDPYALARLRKSCELLNAKPGMSVLDVGCHQGEARQFLKDTEYMGIDTLTGHEIDGGFSLNQKFDRILCLEVLEHLRWPRKTLASIASHLDDAGICVISLPNEATLFHRVRALFGYPDAEAFEECGKHLHLPSLEQARAFVADYLHIVQESFYCSDGAGSRQSLVSSLLKMIPPVILSKLADAWPSMFARGFIFVCKKL